MNFFKRMLGKKEQPSRTSYNTQQSIIIDTDGISVGGEFLPVNKNDEITLYNNTTIVVPRSKITKIHNDGTIEVNSIKIDNKYLKNNNITNIIVYYLQDNHFYKSEITQSGIQQPKTKKNESFVGSRKINHKLTRKTKQKKRSKMPTTKQTLRGGHVPNEIYKIIYNTENRNKFINNLGRPLKTGFFGSKKQHSITPTQMNKDVENLKRQMNEMHDDDKYKLCAELVLSLYDSLDVIRLPQTSPNQIVFNGWASDELKSSVEFINFVNTYCFKEIKEYEWLQRQRKELQSRMSAKGMSASVASAAAPNKKTEIKHDTLMVPNNNTEFAKVTLRMSQLQMQPDIKQALDELLVGVNQKDFINILYTLGYTKQDISEIITRLLERQEIIPPGIYSYNIISNGEELLIVAVNNEDKSKFLLTNFYQKVELVPDENGDFYLYAFEPNSKPPKVMQYKLSIYGIYQHSKGTNRDKITSQSFKDITSLKRITRFNSAGPRLTGPSKAAQIAKLNTELKLTPNSKPDQTHKKSKGPNVKKVGFGKNTSICQEYTDMAECQKNQDCEYVRRKCRTKRANLKGQNATKYSSSSSKSSSNNKTSTTV